MKMTWDTQNHIRFIYAWLDGQRKGTRIHDVSDPVRSLLFAYEEAMEQNRILSRVLIEAAARGIELREPPPSTPVKTID